jgi:hypothetical protein
MRSNVATAVRKTFERRLRDELPQFRRVNGLAVPDVCRVYEWRATELLRLYLMLQLHRREDSFTIEIGWSLDGRWPEHPSFPRSLPRPGDFREVTFRIGLLWSEDPDFWWDLAPSPSAVPLDEALKDYGAFLEGVKNRPNVSEVIARVAPAVEDVFVRLREHGLPYFREIATAAGVTLSSADSGTPRKEDDNGSRS